MNGKNGYFNNAEKEYIIENMTPVRPLINYLWSEYAVASTNQFGCGTCFACVGTLRRPMLEGGENRLVYIKDRDSGEFYSPSRNFFSLPFDEFKTRVGLGYQTVIGEYDGVRTEFTVSVPKSDYVELYQIKVSNKGKKARNLSLYFYNRPAPNLTWHTSYGTGDYNDVLGGLYYPHDGFALEHSYTSLFLKADRKPDAYDVTDRFFKGVYNNLSNPIALKNDLLSCQGTTFEDDFCGAMQFNLSLEKGESQTISFVFGTAQNLTQASELGAKWTEKGAFEQNILYQKQLNSKYTDVYYIDTPDEYLNTMVNIWLKRQISLGKTWGRVYGKGFRDVMQDITGFVSMDAPLARSRICYALKHQYYSGNPVRMYEPIMEHPYYDGAAWIPIAVLTYLKESGDKSILEEKIPYLDNTVCETVFEHIYKGLRFLLDTTGCHGLTKWGGGDWNDSLNNVGMKGIGESVWLSIATVKAVKEFMEILVYIGGQESLYNRLKAESGKMAENIIQHGWDGEYFIYGFNDAGEKVGSHENAEGKIYLNAQTWAVLAGILDKPQLNKIMDTVEARLKCDFGYVQLAPSYTKGSDNLGRVSYFVPGMVENGSVYNHGVTFKIAADAMLKRGDLAYNSFKLISYDNPKNPNSGVEPYVFSNMYIGPENPYRKGEAPMSWITGTAGWLYRSITEYLLGVTAQFDGLKIDPSLPAQWSDVTVSRIYRGAVYNIKFVRGKTPSLTFDGKALKGNTLPICEEGSQHQAVCTIV